jgi:hypothetical protein
MKRRVDQAVLRIALLIEEFSESELDEAVGLLKQHGVGVPSLLSYLGGKRSGQAEKNLPSVKGAQRTPSAQGRLHEFQTTDPEKYEVLNEFQERLRNGTVLADFDEMKKFGSIISKAFVPRKSRKETIPALIACMAERPLIELNEILGKLSSYEGSADGGYQELAEFIIKGKRPQ